jgi:thiamine kinase-like enzyme
MSDPADLAVEARIAALPCWPGAVTIEPLSGGMTNRNYLVRAAGQGFVARIGTDLPLHGVLRFNERAAARAAHAAGVSPEVVHADNGVLVCRYIEGRTLEPADLRDPARLAQIASLLHRVHDGMAAHWRGPALTFWVFQVVRNYARVLEQAASHLLERELPAIRTRAAELEAAVGPVRIGPAHNDLLAANFIDDASRLWLIDWDYAGFNTPLFDLANLSADNGFTPELDALWLSCYLGRDPDAATLRSFQALREASMLRELLWGAVSHLQPQVAFDFEGYTREWLGRWREAR